VGDRGNDRALFGGLFLMGMVALLVLVVLALVAVVGLGG
jgi:hypothetical protein